LLNKLDAGNPAFGGSVFFYDAFLQPPGIGPATSIPMPATPSFIAWIRNRSATAILAINATHASGATGNVLLGPGDVWIYFAAGKPTGGGINTITVQGTASTNATCEVYVSA
jgi:hypothetical protein